MTSIISSKMTIREQNDTQQQLMTNILMTKMEFEQGIDYHLNRQIIRGLLSDNFGSPTVHQLKKQRKRLESLSTSQKDQSDNLSVSTNDSVWYPPQSHELPVPVFDPCASLVDEAIFRGCKKVAQIKELLLNFEEHFVANAFFTRPMASKFMGESIKLLSILLPTLDDMKYQHHDAIALSILYITTEFILSRKDFLKSIDRVVKKKCTKLSTIRKSKSYEQLTKLIGKQRFMSDKEIGVPKMSPSEVPSSCY